MARSKVASVALLCVALMFAAFLRPVEAQDIGRIVAVVKQMFAGNVQVVAPTDQQILKYTAATNTWAAGNGAPPIGAAGGDLTGTYPNPTLAKISALAAHSVTLSEGASALAGVAPVASGSCLVSAGVAADPVMLALGLVLDQLGTTPGNLLVRGTTPTGYTTLPDVAAGQVLVSGGVGGLPAYSASPSVLNVIAGTGAASTTATGGFAYTQGGAGPPTGVPTLTPSGSYPIYIDTTNFIPYEYSGGAWHAVSTTVSLQTAYNGGNTIAVASALPVTLTNTNADTTATLSVSKAPGSSTAGNAISATLSSGGGSAGSFFNSSATNPGGTALTASVGNNLTFGGTVISASSGTQNAASVPLFTGTATWNAAGVTFTGASITITNTASAAGSLGLLVSGATISCPGAGSASERFGNGATASGSGGTSYGYQAVAGSNDGVSMGYQATISGGSGSGVVIGPSAVNAGGAAVVVMGKSASSAGQSYCVVLNGTATGPNQFIVGGSNPISDAYVGNGVTAAAPQAVTYRGTGSSTNGTAGASLAFAGGLANQASDSGGSVSIQTAVTGTGTTLVDRVKPNAVAKSLTNNTLTSLVTATLATDDVSGFKLSYSVRVSDSVGHHNQVEAGIVQFSAANNNGTVAAPIVSVCGVPARYLESGTLTVTWDVTQSGATGSIRVNVNSSLTATTETITYTIMNDSDASLAIQ